MVIPSRNDNMIKNLMKLREQPPPKVIRYDEEQEYKHLMWDKEHGQLSPFKMNRFKELENKYGHK